MKKQKLPLGISNFKDVVTGNYRYVDKTLLIKDIIDKGDKILLIPRPRRFGKTLNISMIKYFYDCCPEAVLPDTDGQYPTHKNDLPKNSYKKLFENLNINKTGQEYQDIMGKHPVIFLSFRSIKEPEWETCMSKIKYLIKNEYLKHDYLLHSPLLKSQEKDFFKLIVDLKGSISDYGNSLEKLLVFLSRYYNERAVILIDEYDAPIHAGFTYNYYEQIIQFIQGFLCGGLKDTDEYLEKGIVTGILRIAKESIFSGLNNPGVYTLTSNEFNDKFGFTEKEVEALLTDFNLIDRYDEVKQWYNGYMFGSQVIYNPWSIINFLENIDHELLPYWLNTSNNELIGFFLSKGGKELKKELEQLIQGEPLEKIIDENMVMQEITVRDNLLWSFLLLSGYLKYTSKRREIHSGKTIYTLAIPNLEVRTAYVNIVENYFSAKIENEKLESMLKALIAGDVALFEEMLQMVVTAVFSYHDLTGEPEKVYHALVAGLLVWISNTHEIKSNRESGYGRYDIMIIPKNPALVGYIIEFKAVNKRKKETIQVTAEAALQQIEDKQYETELTERGIHHIKKLAVVFSGKRVFVKEKQGKNK